MVVFKRAIEVGRQIMEQFSFSIDDNFRHYDFTKKDCPKMFVPIEYVVRKKTYYGNWNWEVFKYFLEVGLVQEKIVEVEVIKEVEKEVVKEVEKPLNLYPTVQLFAALFLKFGTWRL